MAKSQKSKKKNNSVARPKEATGDAAVRSTRHISATYSGPLPPPEMLRNYDQVCPGLADVLVNAFVDENQHRHGLEVRSTEADIKAVETFLAHDFKLKRTGQRMACGLAALALVLGAYTATHGAPTTGGVIGGSTVVGLAIAFLYGKKTTVAPPTDESSNAKA